MAEPIVRRLLIDLDAPFARHWCGGDPFRTALFNSHLERQGLVNDWERRAAARLKLLEGADPRHWLAITAANEHFTAILAEWLLRNVDLLGDTEPRLRTMWLWHSAEESEHRSTAFDLYRALGGDETWRRRWFRRITVIFVGDTLRQTVANLRRDGTLWQWRTWRSAAAFLFGPRGLVRQTFAPWRAYRRRDFHPDELRSDLSSRWLRDNASAWSAVGTSAALSSR